MDVPVDGVVIQASGVLANESAMTGESDELKKEAKALKEALQKERGGNVANANPMAIPSAPQDLAMSMILSINK